MHLLRLGPVLDGGSNTRQAFPFIIDGTVAGGGATSASLSVYVNAPTLRAGNRLVISAALAGGGPTRYDAYVLIDIPGGGVFSVTPGGPVPGVVPYISNVSAVPLSGPLLDLTLPAVPLGTYGVRGYLTATGQPTPASQVSHAGGAVTHDGMLGSNGRVRPSMATRHPARDAGAGGPERRHLRPSVHAGVNSRMSTPSARAVARAGCVFRPAPTAHRGWSLVPYRVTS